MDRASELREKYGTLGAAVIFAQEQEAVYLRQQLEQAEARVAELESIGSDLLHAHKMSEVDWQAFRELETALGRKPSGWLLRKQAEAVDLMCNQWLKEAELLPAQHEHKGRGSSTYNWQTHYAREGEQYAQRLRQQADELEKGGESCTHS